MSYDSNISFYHGKLSREEAESLLKDSGGEGTFLVRDSASSTGDYVLSVLGPDEVVHYQIRKHEDDAFFSIDELTISHGLETLIEYYQEDSHGLVTTLKNPILKDPPPPDTRRHGQTNLLHRATKNGNIEIVVELLKSGYRSLEAKNQEGQTAVHLACQLSQNDILEKLIARGANVNCRDSEGNTPLHYACHRNSPRTIQILVENGGANIQMRNTKTGWVVLHEAASRGYIDCVTTLLSLGAPLRPRTISNELPIDLARKNGHQDCADIFTEYQSPTPKTKKSDWYHGTLERVPSIQILKNFSDNDGSFLVRYSIHSGYVLTMLYLLQDYHFVIQKQDQYYFIDDGPLLDSLECLIEYYMTVPDGLPCKLLSPVEPAPNPPLPDTPHPSSFSTLPKSFPKRAGKLSSLSLAELSNLNIHQASTLPLRSKVKAPEIVLHPSWSSGPIIEKPEEDNGYIPRDNIILREVIGEGEFGSVKHGILQTRGGFEEEVAVKTLHMDNADSNRKEFLREASVMMKLNHECIVKFIGICTEPELLMILELVPLGSMLRYLLESPNLVSPTYELIIWASQIARGMEYLEKQRFVHRDLAARNILLATKYQIKITDFGLSRTLCKKDYYRATEGGRWPIKWYAPESYNFGTFSSASDVWSFGVTLWEMYSYGQQPYGALKGSEVTDLIDKGERLAQPRKCPNDVYETMSQCWQYSAVNRPTFSELVDKFRCPEYMNINELINTS